MVAREISLRPYNYRVTLIAWGSLLAFLISIGFAFAQAKTEKPLTIKELFQNGQPRDLQGKVVTARQFEGKPTMVVFWEEWCPRCAEEVPTLNKINERFQSKGLRIVGVSISATPQQVKEFIKKNSPKYPLLVGNQKMASGGGVAFVPTLLLFDKQGNFSKRIVGCQTEKALASAVDEMLK